MNTPIEKNLGRLSEGVREARYSDQRADDLPFACFVNAVGIRFDVPFKTRFEKRRTDVFLLAKNVEDVPSDGFHSLALVHKPKHMK
jgi:hypothetical protein